MVAELAAALALAVGGAPPRPRLDAYRGLATWVDVYDREQWERPVATVRAMRARGVRTVFLQTSSYRRANGIARPVALGRFLETAHAGGLRVVGWYLPSFARPGDDFRRALAAIRFRSPGGQRFDSFALDIEAEVVKRPALRSARLLALSRRLRTAAPGYPLGAIVPSPRGMELSPGYWPGFPYRELAASYDVFVPMGYFTYRVDGPLGAAVYTRRNVAILRRETDDPALPIHLAGGVAGDATLAEVRGFAAAAARCGVLGASLYDYASTKPAQWAGLRGVAAGRPAGC